MAEFDAAWAGRLLAGHGRRAEPLRQLDGWSNRVWIGPDAVVRVSQGRFRDSFRHEAAVLARIAGRLPVPQVIAFGEVGARQWLILTRAPGAPLMSAWPGMDAQARASALSALGDTFRRLHTLTGTDDLVNPWLHDAVTQPGKAADAYRTQPEQFDVVLSSLRRSELLPVTLLERATAWLAERADLYSNDQRVLVHGDAHFNNVLWDAEHGVTLIDFEVATHLAADRELEAIVDMVLHPAEYVAPGEATARSAADFADVLDLLRDACPSLFVADLAERMRVWFTMRALLQCHHFAVGSAWDPRPRLTALLEGSFSLPRL